MQNGEFGITTTTYTDESSQGYKKCVVILIDIIGFKNFVDNNSCDKLLEFFGGIEKIVNNYDEIKKNTNPLHPLLTFFSDTIFIVLPIYGQIYDDLKIPEFSGLLASIRYFASQIQMYALRFGLLTRGGVSFGEVYYNGLKWFGPALNEAYTYESQYAIFPRVVLAPSAVELLKEAIEANQKQDQWVNLRLGDDGLYFLDYFQFIGKINYNGDSIEAHNKVKEIIESNLRNDSLPVKAKLKWQWLARYVNSETISKKEFYKEKRPVWEKFMLVEV